MAINKVVVIDDEMELVEIFSTFLKSKDFEVDAFSSGEDALEALKKKSYDLVLTDKKMPYVSGIDIIEYIEEQSPNTIIFMITGDEHDSMVFKNNKSQVLSKPISLVELNEKIEKL